MSAIEVPELQTANKSWMKGYDKFLRNSRDDVVQGLVKKKLNIEVDQALKVEKSHQYQQKAFEQVRAEKKALGKHKVDGLGQLKSVIPATYWFRHHLCRPGAMQDKTYNKEFLRDNPDCKAI